MKKKALTGTICMTLALLGGARAPTAHASAWFFAEIDRIQVAPNGAIDVYTHSGVNHECGSNRMTFIDPNAVGARMIYAALLSYEAQREPVQFLIMSCSGTTGIFANIEGNPG